MAIHSKKKCKQCGELKLVTEFEEKGKRNSVMQYGTVCKSCKDSNKAKLSKKGEILDIEETISNIDEITEELEAGVKTCRICHKKKPLAEFYKDRISNGIQRHRNECKVCSIEGGKERTKKYNDMKATLVNDLTEDQWQQACEFFNYKCCYCAVGNQAEKEHIVPVSQGGGFTAANIVPSCKSCNTSKGGRNMVQWFASMPFFSKERLSRILEWIKMNSNM